MADPTPTITMAEKPESRALTTGDAAQQDKIYLVKGSPDEVLVGNYVAANTPAIYNNLARQSVKLDPVTVDETTVMGQWTATVHYGIRKPQQAGGEISLSVDTTGGTQHITQSLQTVQWYQSGGGAPPNFSQAIGVTHDSVEGVDITCPVFNFTLRRRVALSTMTTAYVAGLYNLTGKANQAAFSVTITIPGTAVTFTMSFAAGEVLFLGASFDASSSSQWVEINYRFAASPNRTGITIGDMTGIIKNGWQYMWVRYMDSTSVTPPAVIKKPVSVYVEKVYLDGDFGVLALV